MKKPEISRCQASTYVPEELRGSNSTVRRDVLFYWCGDSTYNEIILWIPNESIFLILCKLPIAIITARVARHYQWALYPSQIISAWDRPTSGAELLPCVPMQQHHLSVACHLLAPPPLYDFLSFSQLLAQLPFLLLPATLVLAQLTVQRTNILTLTWLLKEHSVSKIKFLSNLFKSCNKPYKEYNSINRELCLSWYKVKCGQTNLSILKKKKKHHAYIISVAYVMMNIL